MKIFPVRVQYVCQFFCVSSKNDLGFIELLRVVFDVQTAPMHPGSSLLLVLRHKSTGLTLQSNGDQKWMSGGIAAQFRKTEVELFGLFLDLRLVKVRHLYFPMIFAKIWNACTKEVHCGMSKSSGCCTACGGGRTFSPKYSWRYSHSSGLNWFDKLSFFPGQLWQL